MGRYNGKKCRLLTMFGMTSGFFLVELIVGYLTNSMALVADSFHMLSDVASLIIAFLSVKVCADVFLFVSFLISCLTDLICLPPFRTRCPQRNGRKTHLDGLEPKSWVHWLIQFSLSHFVFRFLLNR